MIKSLILSYVNSKMFGFFLLLKRQSIFEPMFLSPSTSQVAFPGKVRVAWRGTGGPQVPQDLFSGRSSCCTCKPWYFKDMPSTRSFRVTLSIDSPIHCRWSMLLHLRSQACCCCCFSFVFIGTVISSLVLLPYKDQCWQQFFSSMVQTFKKMALSAS